MSIFRYLQNGMGIKYKGNKNVARSEQSSHTPAVAIRGCNTFRDKDKIVKDFIILNQVVAEKTLMKNVHMCYMGVTEGKIENLKNDGKMRINIFISFTQYT